MAVPTKTDDLVSLDDACWLAVGVPPAADMSGVSLEDEMRWIKIRSGEDLLGPPNARASRGAIDAVKSGELPAFLVYGPHRPLYAGIGLKQVQVGFDPNPSVDCGKTQVDRGDFTAWLWRVHGVRSNLLPDPCSVPSTTANPRMDVEVRGKARRNALAIIAALAELADEDISNPHAKNGPADRIADKIESRFGFTLGRRSIGDWLTEARDLMRDEGK